MSLPITTGPNKLPMPSPIRHKPMAFGIRSGPKVSKTIIEIKEPIPPTKEKTLGYSSHVALSNLGFILKCLSFVPLT